MKKEIKNLPASIHAQLKRRAEVTGRPFQEVLYFYAFERFLDRLSQSKYCESFILKGGLAFLGWGVPLRRPTLDIDFLAYLDNSIEEVKRVVEEICSIPVNDGIFFDTSTIKVETIMPDAEYNGVRVRFLAYLGRAKVWLQVDISFTNVITPKEVVIKYPTLLEMPNFELRCYNPETAIAEKFQAMVFLGETNGRMKDYYDIYLLAKECEFDGLMLVRAFIATFDNRETKIPIDTPVALSKDFALANQNEWLGFLKRMEYQGEEIYNFEEVVDFARRFLLLPMQSAAKREEFHFHWTVGGGWLPS